MLRPVVRMIASILIALAPLANAADPAPTVASVLASYSFDDTVATGPDTFAVWQGARHTETGRGSVSLSSAFHLSGYRSVELRDVPGDHDFPELQGYFPGRAAGSLVFHFAFLTTDAGEELNVALAGPRFFQVEKDGIAFWLGTRKGELVHVSDAVEKKLFPVEAFVWYVVDVSYDVAVGTYSLAIHREGQEAALVSLRGQPNAPGRPGSAVDKFSFVGSPFGDRSSVVYYVDDVVIGTDERVKELPFVAPGRRKLFVDRFRDYQKLLQERPRCLPPSGPEDVGLSPADLVSLGQAGLLHAAERLLAGERQGAGQFVRQGQGHWKQVFGAVAEWNAGCEALENGDSAAGLAHFEKARTDVPEGPIFTLSSVLALTGLRRFGEADELLLSLSTWRDDPRYAVASAYVGLNRGDLDRAEAWLRDPAARALDRDQNPLLRLMRNGIAPGALATLRAQLGGAFRERLEETLVAEQYYYVQLWKGRHELARDYAQRMAERLRRVEVPTGAWMGRAGDAAFYGQDLALAKELYYQALADEKDHGVLMALYLRLADVAYLQGDLETERQLREHYYGVLGE